MRIWAIHGRQTRSRPSSSPLSSSAVAHPPRSAGRAGMKFLEDIRVGDKTALGSHTFTAKEIKTFAQAFDPQPFHLDEVAAARSHFGGLVASGWHTGSVCIRLIVLNRMRTEEAMREGGAPAGRSGQADGLL